MKPGKDDKVLLIKDGQKLGVFSLYDARGKAREFELDLVEVAPNARPPVCVIMDYGKFMYEKQKHKKKTSVIKEKEVSFRYVIDEHDLEIKMNQVKKFLLHGDKVRIVVKFKSREKAHKEQGWVIMKKALEMLGDMASIEQAPRMDGMNIITKITHNGKPPKVEQLQVKE